MMTKKDLKNRMRNICGLWKMKKIGDYYASQYVEIDNINIIVRGGLNASEGQDGTMCLTFFRGNAHHTMDYVTLQLYPRSVKFFKHTFINIWEDIHFCNTNIKIKMCYWWFENNNTTLESILNKLQLKLI